MNKYNLDLLKQLNEEYRNNEIVEKPWTYERDEQIERAEKRVRELNQKIPLKGLQILEIGCGNGFLCDALSRLYDCDSTGVDLTSYDYWKEFTERNPRVHYVQGNMCNGDLLKDMKFDLILSYVVWEHMWNPFEGLLAAKNHLKENGLFYLYAWQYRSARASHLYRQIFFPYPHLLFDDELLVEYALSAGADPEYVYANYSVNKVTYGTYKEYFRLLGFTIQDEKLRFRPLDVEFYKRFEDKLGRYPIFDLTLDSFALILKNDGKVEDSAPLGVGEILVETKAPLVGDTVLINIPTVGSNLEYAWDIFIEERKISFVKWNKDNCVTFVPEEIGAYRVKCYVRKIGGSKRTVRWSDSIHVK